MRDWHRIHEVEKLGNPSLDELLHRPFGLLCIEQQNNELALVVAQTSTQTEYTFRANLHGMGALCPVDHYPSGYEESWQAKLLLISDILPSDGVRSNWLWLEYWTIKINEDTLEDIGEEDVGTWLLVGRWHSTCNESGVVLNINRRSACFDLLELGECTIKVKGRSTLGSIASNVVELSSLLHVHKNIFNEFDILAPALRPKLQVSDSVRLISPDIPSVTSESTPALLQSNSTLSDSDISAALQVSYY